MLLMYLLLWTLNAYRGPVSAPLFDPKSDTHAGIAARPLDSIPVFQYYEFIQRYDSARIVFRFGECQLHARGRIINTGLTSFSEVNNRPLRRNTPYDLQDLSGCNPMPFHNGDTLYYYWTILETREMERDLPWMNVPDTIIFYLDILKYPGNALLSTIDSIGYLPHTSVADGWRKLVRSRSDGPVRSKVLPNYPDSVKMIRVRIRPEFHGDKARLRMSRWDFIEAVKISEKMSEYYRQLFIAYKSVIDSILSPFYKRPANAKIPPDNSREIRVSRIPGQPDAVLIGIAITSPRENLTLRLFNSFGQSIGGFDLDGASLPWEHTVSLAGRPGGTYYLLLYSAEKVIAFDKFNYSK